MDCRQARLVLSASLDGEALTFEERPLREHLAGCAACRSFEADAVSLHRLMRIAPAEQVPDLTAAILARTELPAVAPRGRALRLGLVGIALVQVLLALPTLIGGVEHTRHLAAFDLALAVGFLWVAARPAPTLSGFLPIGTALVLFCVGISFSDAVRGLGETARTVAHSVAVLGMIAAWVLEAQTHRRTSVSLAA